MKIWGSVQKAKFKDRKDEEEKKKMINGQVLDLK